MRRFHMYSNGRWWIVLDVRPRKGNIKTIKVRSHRQAFLIYCNLNTGVLEL